MYNFLDCKLKPKVTASCPSSDDFEVENLISHNLHLRNKGFIAYSAIKPPVDVNFEFLCPIKLHCVLIWTNVGEQKSRGVEFKVKNEGSEFLTICRTYSEAPGIVLYNKRRINRQPDHIPNDFLIQYCKSSVMVDNVREFCVRIFHTKSSVPCIQKIEIWGSVSKSCSDVTKNTIDLLMSNKRHNVQIALPSNIITQPKETIKPINEEFNIPDDFIDPITCDVMSIPMTLPCGKTVDQITLEKFQQSQAHWGRSPRDPYTGLEFTKSRKPILNAALKNRIDRFLTENAHIKETFNIQRTVGTKRQYPITKIETNDAQSTTGNSDLDSVINNAMKLYKITRYSKNYEEVKVKSDVCGFCKTSINLYTITCSHFICKSCLNTVVFRCKVCYIPFQRCDVKKYHN